MRVQDIVANLASIRTHAVPHGTLCFVCWHSCCSTVNVVGVAWHRLIKSQRCTRMTMVTSLELPSAAKTMMCCGVPTTQASCVKCLVWICPQNCEANHQVFTKFPHDKVRTGHIITQHKEAKKTQVFSNRHGRFVKGIQVQETSCGSFHANILINIQVPRFKVRLERDQPCTRLQPRHQRLSKRIKL